MKIDSEWCGGKMALQITAPEKTRENHNRPISGQIWVRIAAKLKDSFKPVGLSSVHLLPASNIIAVSN